MISRISQLKQTLSEEFQQNSQQKQANDPISTIERNAKLLTSDGPNVDSIIMDLEESQEQNSDDSASITNHAENGEIRSEGSPQSGGSDKQGPGEAAEGENNLEHSDSVAEKEQSSGPAKVKETSRSDEDENASIEDERNATDQEASESEATGGEEPNAERQEEASKSTDSGTPSTQPSATSSTSAPPSAPPSAPLSASSATTNARSVPMSAPVTSSGGNNGVNSRTDPDLQAKLTKFAKYEEKYPQLLRAYKLEKKRSDLVRLYEKVLSEHTPCSSIAEPQVLVNYLQDLNSKTTIQQREIERLSTRVKEAQSQIDDLKNSSAKSMADLSKSRTDLENLKQQYAQMESEALQAKHDTKLENELRSRVSALESELKATEQARDTAAKSQTISRSQLDELNTRLRETLAEVDILRDELQESERLAQERLQELSAIKGQMLIKEKGRRRSVDDTVTQLSNVVTEKEQLEAEVEFLNKRIIREADQLNLQIKSLRTQLRDSEAHEEELRRQLIQSQAAVNEVRSPIHSKASSSADLKAFTRRLSSSGGLAEFSADLGAQSQQESLSAELADAREAAASAAKANELLKQVNADNSLRIEKLQKMQRALSADFEKLKHENFLLKRRGRSGSISSTNGSQASDVEEESAEQQKAYLKNVLLGFIEHKGQRRNLMPVLTTLLDLSDSETDRLMREFL